jgi:hypothetical protein
MSGAYYHSSICIWFADLVGRFLIFPQGLHMFRPVSVSQYRHYYVYDEQKVSRSPRIYDLYPA